MTAELVHGQNHPLPATRLEIRITADRPVVAGVTLGDGRGTVRGADWVAHPGAPTLPGLEVPRQAAAEHRLAIDLGALPESVERVHVLLALPSGVGGPERFGALTAPHTAVTGLDGTEIASFSVTGLDAESAVTALELYLRRGAWKVRAVGQGYAGGLAAMLADHGLPRAAELAEAINAAVAEGMSQAVAPPPRAPRGEQARSGKAGGSREGRVGKQWAPPGSGGGGAERGERPTARTADGAAQDPAPAEARSGEAQAGGTRGGTTGAASPGGHAGPGAGTASGSDPTGKIDYRHPRRRTGPSHGEQAGPGPWRPDGAGGDAAGPGGPPPQRYGSPGGTSADDPSGPRHRAAGAPPAPGAGPPPAGPAPAAGPPPAGEPATPVAGDAPGWSMDERLYNQVWGMFEDLARTVAAYRSAVDFAGSRMDRELDRILADPATRSGPAADAARAAAQTRHGELVDRARAALDRDLDQLTAETEVVEPALPPAYAGWDNPCWHAYAPPAELPMALRLGDLHLPESPALRIPLLVRLPLDKGMWVDSGADDPELGDAGRIRALAADTAVAHAARLLAAYPPGQLTLHVIDPGGGAAPALAPLLHSGVLPAPPQPGAAGVRAALAHLTERVDLVQMALRSGAVDALPPGVDTADQLLLVHDFPHGFDDRAITQLRYLADEGPTVGVHLLLVADREDARAYGPVLDPLWRSLLRLPPVADDHLADPWIGHMWTYEPPRVPAGSAVLGTVLAAVAEGRARRDR